MVRLGFFYRILLTSPSSKFPALVLCGNRTLFHMIGRSEMNSFVIRWAQYIYYYTYHVQRVDSLLLAPYWSSYLGDNGVL